MDRVISLLAALVGLIALGGAILVHVNGDNQRREMAAEIAELKVSIGLSSSQQPVKVAEAEPVHVPSAEHIPSAEPASSEPPASPAVAALPSAEPSADLKALQDRIAQLEQANQAQASQLAEAQAKLAAGSAASSEAPAISIAAVEPSTALASTAPAGLAADGPTKDCIPLGTRFMGAAGDSFPICKTKLVLKVAAVTEGLASITGAGDVAVGASVPYDKNCMLAVFSADTSGYAEMRVTCN